MDTRKRLPFVLTSTLVLAVVFVVCLCSCKKEDVRYPLNLVADGDAITYYDAELGSLQYLCEKDGLLHELRSLKHSNVRIVGPDGRELLPEDLISGQRIKAWVEHRPQPETARRLIPNTAVFWLYPVWIEVLPSEIE